MRWGLKKKYRTVGPPGAYQKMTKITAKRTTLDAALATIPRRPMKRRRCRGAKSEGGVGAESSSNVNATARA
jgi:hypothetical protein